MKDSEGTPTKPALKTLKLHLDRKLPIQTGPQELLTTAAGIKKVFMGDIAFVVRPLPANGLDGAFRVHLAPEALIQLGLKVGDVCTIIGEDGIRGTGIAWRAADKMGSSPRVQPAKMSETLRDTFGFKQGTHVRIEKTPGARIVEADKIALTDVTPVDYDGTDDGCWTGHCIATLVKCEAFAVGTTFDVNARRGLRKRFFIEHIDSDAPTGTPALYCYRDTTDMRILDGPLHSSMASTSQLNLQIDPSRIGGLEEQLTKLNTRLRLLCSKARALHGNAHYPWNQSILLHGYEGTGKTLLLDELAKTPGLRKAVRIGKDQLLGTASKNQSVIQAAFHEALASQPSLLLIDDVDKIAPGGDTTTASTANVIASSLESVYGTGVLVVAAARSPSNVDSTLIAPRRFRALIELPIPDNKARIQILSALLSPSINADLVGIATNIGSRTHGFTGRDLAELVEVAMFHAVECYEPDAGEWVDVSLQSSTHQPSASADSSEEPRVSTATTLVERPPTPSVTLSISDFETALIEVRPHAIREIILETPKVTFDDIGGSAPLRSRFDRIISWPMQYPHLFAQWPRLQPKRGVLLYGPPGCSKTMTAQAVANTYGLNFIAVKGAELISMYVGESERAVREVFRKARQAAPSIVFFDEIDSMGGARSSSSSDASKGLNVLTTLLNEMDGFEAMKNVLVLAATNKPESLDPALLRPGRFDEHIYLGPPDEDARREILRLGVKGTPGHESVDLDLLVQQTEGMSGAEIVNACNLAATEAIARAVAGGENKIMPGDFDKGAMQTPRGITAAMLQGYEAFGKGARTSN